ncbi:hypothetical protein EDB80DRAFT_745897 [Ilyonectria destructans]|nr:hypothetical protein EDB80DRAFT_745897 [Ilyonectria destructans]
MAAQNNELYSKAGLDTVTDEEHEHLTLALSALADADSADATGILNDALDSAPGSSVDNVFYINFNPKTNTLSQQIGFFSTKANQTTANKVAAGEIGKGDQILQANYTAKVINYLVQNAPWYVVGNSPIRLLLESTTVARILMTARLGSTLGIQTQNKKFTVEKNKFHQALVSNFTEGLTLPKTILDKLEGFLTNVKNFINPRARLQTACYFHLHHAPHVRTIYFKPSQSLSTYMKSKNDRSSGVNVNIDFQYVQRDGSFNKDLFESSDKVALTASQSQVGTDFATTKKPLDIPVGDD